MKTILHFVKKEFLQFKRDPKMFVMILLAPIIQLIFLGYAATMDVTQVKTAVYDLDKSQTSRNFIEKFNSSGYFQTNYYVDNYDELTALIDKSEVILGLVIPDDFEKKINNHETAPVQALFEGSDGNSAQIAAGYVNRITAEYSKELLTEIKSTTGNKITPVSSISAKIRAWYNPQLKTRNFMVPGIVALLLMLITLILTSLAVVKEKEIGTLEQLVVTPINPYQLILGKLIPFIILAFAAIIIVLTVMTIIFGIVVKGSILFLFISSFVYILSMLGLGLFISTISKTQQQAMMLAIFLLMMPMVFLSGFAFPIENMPKIIQYVTYIIPLRYFITIIRGVILKGIGFAELWSQLLILLIMGVGILFLSSLRFRKRLG